MAHVKKGHLAKTVEWWKHLRHRKRDQWKRERKAGKKEIKRQINE